MKRFLTFLWVFVSLMQCPFVVLASETACEISQQGNNIMISGVISEQSQARDVSLLIGGRENPVYAWQTTTDENGEFQFDFAMPKSVESGTYEFEIGSDIGAIPYKGTIDYIQYKPEIKCDKIDVDNRNIVITGIVENCDNPSMMSLLVGGREAPVYAWQTTTDEDGAFEFNFLMPEGVGSGVYEFEIGSDIGATPYKGTIDYIQYKPEIKCSTIDVDNRNVVIKGIVENCDNQCMMSLLVGGREAPVYAWQTTTDEDGAFEFNFLMPEGVESGTYQIEIGSDTGTQIYSTSFVYRVNKPIITSKTVSGSADEIINVTVNCSNIKMLSGRLFILVYNPEQVSFIKDVLCPNIYNPVERKIELISHENGEIKFKINSEYANEENEWNGAADIFKFKFDSDYSGETTFELSCCTNNK